MFGFLLVVHLLVCVGLVGVVLVQSGKGGGLAGGAFGGTAQTVFGGRGATDFLTKATMALGVAFFLTSLVLSLMSSGVIGRQRSLISREMQRATAPASGQRAPGQPPAGAARGQVPAPAPAQAPASPGGGR
jgi:preprotein translocase subunit SecG